MPAINGVMLQYFHWDLPNDGALWTRLVAEAPALAAAGFTALWLPPPTKAFEPGNPGYAGYDLWDLGEFDQKGSVRTKYGTRAELEAAIGAVHAAGMQAYLDVVFNHKAGADDVERVRAVPVDRADRNRDIGPERDIDAWTLFRFDGRGAQGSAMRWTHDHFDSVDYDNLTGDRQIFRICERPFETVISPDMGNYDFLMFADIDSTHPQVREEFRAWGEWMVETIGFDGFRIDAAKHIRADLFVEWLAAIDARFPDRAPMYAVGEYFDEQLDELTRYLDALGGRMSVFDFPLYFNFRAASDGGGGWDMRNLVQGALVGFRPMQAATFVDNHDTAREHTVQEWFKPLAYAVILLRSQGYPCVFWLDYFGGPGRAGHRAALDAMLRVRRDHAYGPQRDYFDHENVVGWVRLGDADHPRAVAVLMSDGPGGVKTMATDRPGARFRDWTGGIGDVVVADATGAGAFRCNGGSVSVWVEEPA